MVQSDYNVSRSLQFQVDLDSITLRYLRILHLLIEDFGYLYRQLVDLCDNSVDSSPLILIPSTQQHALLLRYLRFLSIILYLAMS